MRSLGELGAHLDDQILKNGARVPANTRAVRPEEHARKITRTEEKGEGATYTRLSEGGRGLRVHLFAKAIRSFSIGGDQLSPEISIIHALLMPCQF